MMKYGKSVITGFSFEEAIDAAKSLLRDEGFGVLCEIDVTTTLREKIAAEFRPYRILGACNPYFALEALQGEAHLGLLLPCNVVIQELSGEVIVSAIDAHALLSVVDNSKLVAIADDVNAKLGRVLDSLAANQPLAEVE
ncbi:MAG: DUF302 domain-containing protein [Candidatus Cybelea sp.]